MPSEESFQNADIIIDSQKGQIHMRRPLLSPVGYIKKRRLLLRRKRDSFQFEAKGSWQQGRNVKGGSCLFSPEWTAAIEGYTVRVLHKNLWRFSAVMSFDDAYQEAYLKFMELKEKYEGKINHPRWFMSLYKTALKNRITDLANSNRKLSRQLSFTDLGEVISGTEGAVVEYQDALLGETDTGGILELKIAQAPAEVRKVLVLLLQSDPVMLAAIADSWEQKGKRGEAGNQLLCRLLGYDARRVNLVESVKDYFEETI